MVLIHKKKVLTPEEQAAEKLKKEGEALGIQDDYQAKGFELVSWVQDHRVLVSGLIVLVFIGGIAFCAYTYYKQRADEAASSAYIEALQPIEDEKGMEDKAKWLEAQTKLQEAAKKYSSSGVAALADIFAGHIGLDNKEAKQAIELYSSATKKLSEKDDLYPLALIGLGYSYESNEQLNEALKQFVSLIDLKNSPAKDLALWEAARLAHELKENDKAKEYAARLLEEFPSSIFEKNARQLRESL